jgi:hypothetical protein
LFFFAPLALGGYVTGRGLARRQALQGVSSERDGAPLTTRRERPRVS